MEADTQPTADGVPVLLHDRDLNRTTSGRGPVRAAPLRDVASLTVRGWPGVWVPRLAELLAMLTPTRALLLELKGYHTSRQIHAVLDEIDVAGVADRVLLQSFEVEVLRELRRAVPDRPFGLLVSALDADPVARCRELGARYYNPAAGPLLGRPTVVVRPACGRRRGGLLDLERAAGVGRAGRGGGGRDHHRHPRRTADPAAPDSGRLNPGACPLSPPRG